MKRNKHLFVDDLEKLLKIWGISDIEKLWLSADDRILTVQYVGGFKKEVNVAMDSLTQILRDMVIQNAI